MTDNCVLQAKGSLMFKMKQGFRGMTSKSREGTPDGSFRDTGSFRGSGRDLIGSSGSNSAVTTPRGGTSTGARSKGWISGGSIFSGSLQDVAKAKKKADMRRASVGVASELTPQQIQQLQGSLQKSSSACTIS